MGTCGFCRGALEICVAAVTDVATALLSLLCVCVCVCGVVLVACCSVHSTFDVFTRARRVSECRLMQLDNAGEGSLQLAFVLPLLLSLLLLLLQHLMIEMREESMIHGVATWTQK